VVIPGQFALSVACARVMQATRLSNAAIHFIVHLNQVTSQIDPQATVTGGSLPAIKL
jgi:hypothetical protein